MTVIEFLVLMAFGVVTSFLLGGFALMITISVMHTYWWPAIPTIKFWVAGVVAMFLPIPFIPFNLNKDSK